MSTVLDVVNLFLEVWLF